MAVTYEAPERASALVSDLLEAATSSGNKRDRLLALIAANRLDAVDGAHRGRIVVSSLMRDIGAQLIQPTTPRNDVSSIMKLRSRSMMAATMREVSVALGPEIGPKVLVGELVKPGHPTVLITDNGEEALVPMRKLEADFGLAHGELDDDAYLSASFPYVVIAAGSPGSIRNFNMAIDAVICGPQLNPDADMALV